MLCSRAVFARNSNRLREMRQLNYHHARHAFSSEVESAMTTSLRRKSVWCRDGPRRRCRFRIAACGGSDQPTPPVANASLRVNRDAAPLGSPIDITYKFVVASDAKFDEDYRVMLHVVDADDELMWTDDHDPPTPTTQWKPGQTVEYTRTGVRPHLPVRRRSHASSRVVFPEDADPADARGRGRGAARLPGRQAAAPAAEREPLHRLQGRVASGGSRRAQRVGLSGSGPRSRRRSRSGTRRRTPPSFWTVDQPGGVFNENAAGDGHAGQHRQSISSSSRRKNELLRRIPLKADQMGAAEMAELQVTVDKTFVPMQISGGASKDPRELGVRVFHAFIQSGRARRAAGSSSFSSSRRS